MRRLFIAVLAVPLLAQPGGWFEAYRRDETAVLRVDDRIAYWERKRVEHPDDLTVHLRLASAFLQKNRETTDASYVGRAASLVDRILSADPVNYQALRLRVEIAMNFHRFPTVVQHVHDLLARNPSDAGLTGLLGDAYMEMGQYEPARKAYERTLDLRGDLASYNRYANYKFVTGQPVEALAWMAQAVRAGSREPENVAWCLVEFGDMLFKLGRLKEAEAAYRDALAKFPGYHRAHAALGRLQAAADRNEDAIHNYSAAQAVVPFPEYAAALARLHEAAGNTAESRRQRGLVDAVERLGRANGEKANRTLAVIYADQDRNLDRALALVQAEFELRNDVYSYDALAWVHYKRGEIAEAREAIGKALALNTPEPSFHYHAAMIAAGETRGRRTSTVVPDEHRQLQPTPGGGARASHSSATGPATPPVSR